MLTLLPVWITIWMSINHDNLMKQEYKDKFEYMYQGIHNGRSRWSKYYFPISLFRRLIFIATPALLYNFPFMQLIVLIFMSSIYIIIYAGVRPHWDKQRTRLEIFNEVMIMFSNYHTVIFSDFCTNPRFQFAMGFSFCVQMGLLVVVNIWFMIKNTMSKSERKRRIAKLKAAQLVMIAEHKEKMEKQEHVKKLR